MIPINKLTKLFYKLAKEHFSYDVLNSLDTFKEKSKYLENFFNIIGWSSRKVFIKNSKKAIKLAICKEAINQNKNEKLILQSISSLLLPKFYNNAPDYSWIEVELVRPLKNRLEREILTNIRSIDFDVIMNVWNDNESYKDVILKLSTKDKTYLNYLENKILKEIDKIKQITNLDVKEISALDNVGKSASGHLVLLDVGKLNP